MPIKVFANGAALSAADVNTYLMNQSVITCTSSTRPASPSTGMFIYETDTGERRFYDGTIWRLRVAQPRSAARWYRSAALSLVSGDVPLDTSSYDYGSRMTSSGYTAPETGLYSVKYRVEWAAPTTAEDGLAQVATSAGTVLTQGSRATVRGVTVGDTFASAGADELVIASGTVIKLVLARGVGSSATVQGSGNSYSTFLAVRRVE
jgi:hypothetical protein